MGRGRTLGAALTAAVVVALAAAPAALAGRVMYGVTPGSGYTVEPHGGGNGITKVWITSCPVAGQPIELPLVLSARGPVKGDATPASWKVLKSDGAQLTFAPASLSLPTSGPTTRATLTITPAAPSGKGLFLRFKLDPANGSGLGQGPGYMIRAACVLAPAPAETPQACPAPEAAPSTPPGNAYGHEGVAGPDGAHGKGKAKGRAAKKGRAVGRHRDDALTVDCPPADGSPAPAPALAAPAVGTFPAVASPQAQQASRCVASPRRMRVVRGEQTAVRVVVAQNGRPIEHAAVRVTTPDGAVVKRTNRAGVAMFYVRPSRTGQLVIQADVCFGADRLAVRGARATSRQAVRPAFTG
jgi:hypothetical protein